MKKISTGDRVQIKITGDTGIIIDTGFTNRGQRCGIKMDNGVIARNISTDAIKVIKPVKFLFSYRDMEAGIIVNDPTRIGKIIAKSDNLTTRKVLNKDLIEEKSHEEIVELMEGVDMFLCEVLEKHHQFLCLP